ncbi:AraC family transcriptional regulator [Bermanella marisrubri]|uniref:AraC-type DNA-binding domain-containing protein n=1 Tax=Bermanella marisrubri TaxID=207949 RepID=Q1N621_9GAMM|nr:AraC family transcriptional regulator [Bermanella marisrubri]EAT13771.1 AraC-type DNA-binding domain-containing protein [Oceanobacter sp. RED65] [Bermanella marisrubri]QIZ84542.1 AraC family transcriptional regulator [Bermanella marisrubri]
MKLGDISVSYARSLLETADALGGNSRELQQQFSLSDSKLSQPEGRISIPRFMRLGFAAIEQTGRADLGLEMGKRVRIPLLGLPGFLAMTAKDIESACLIIAHYERLSSTNCRGQSRFYMDQGKGVASFYSISPYNDYNLFVVDSVLASQHKILEWMCGRSGAVERVEVEFAAPDYASAYEDYFECPVLFGQQRNALIIKSDALSWPLLQHDKNAFLNLKSICDERLAQASRERDLSEKVMDEIGPLLEGQTPTIEQVADSLGMPPWTLRRKLQDHDTSFQNLLNETRRGLAESYMKDTDLAIGEIAYLLGFSSPTAFQRAFKRWTSLSPGQYRKIKRSA